MTAFLSLAFQIAACVGFGAILLRALGVLKELTLWERSVWAFALGYGVLGWLLFFVGVAEYYQPLPLFVLLGLGTLGLFALRQVPPPQSGRDEKTKWSLIDWMLVAALGIALTFDFAEGLSPPADADSLAYHFALPKYFLDEGRLIFIERAMDGAAPLLNQMTYIPPLALGGEKGLTLWTMASGWGATALLYLVARHYLDRCWSLAIAVIFLTTPAIVYGGGSGQAEVRNAMFVIIAAVSVARAVTTSDLRYAALAGLAVGFFMAGKYIGLLFALSCGLAILLQRQWFLHGLVLTIVATIAGGQWYVWNIIHTGDPFFPMLFGTLDYSSVPFWGQEQNDSLQKLFLENEQAVPTNLLWFVKYPFVATFSGFPQFESGRTGLGPYILLLLPFAVAGAWKFRQRIKYHPLLILASIAFLFYSFWFLIGSSQRVRHLVPVLPLAFLVFSVAAHRWARTYQLLKPLTAIVLITLGVQLAGHSVFALNYARYLASDESREAFLRRNVHSYDAVIWINQNLTPNDRLYTISRQFNYLLDVPYFYAHIQQEGWTDIRPEAIDPARFYRQINDRNITHLLVSGDPAIEAPENGLNQWRPLLRMDCVEVVAKIDTLSIGSRSLAQIAPGQLYVLKITDQKCVL
jgi:hypothetical protein